MISALKFCFSDFGIPEEIICDNGPQLTSREYQDFAAKYGFKLTTSTPFYTKGHGYIERQIQTIKNLLKKCDEDKSDPHLALLQLRTTPIDNRTPSPSQLLQNRQLRTTLPAIIRPPPDSEQVRESLQSRQVLTTMMLMPKGKPSSYPLSQYGLNTPKKKVGKGNHKIPS